MTGGTLVDTLTAGASVQERPRSAWDWALTALSGAAIGVVGAGVQALVGYGIDKLFLPRGEDNNIAPRLVKQTFKRFGQRRDDARDWTLGALFHFAYGAAWGATLNVSRAGLRLPAIVLAAPVAIAIYVLAFSRIGLGTLTRAEKHPKRRPQRKQISLIAVDLAYTVPTALLVDALARLGRR